VCKETQDARVRPSLLTKSGRCVDRFLFARKQSGPHNVRALAEHRIGRAMRPQGPVCKETQDARVRPSLLTKRGRSLFVRSKVESIKVDPFVFGKGTPKALFLR